MNLQKASINKIIPAMRQPIQAYAEQVALLAGDNIIGLVFFGAISTSHFDPKRHSAQNVFILHEIDLNMLRALAKLGAKMGKANIAAPLIMTPSLIRSSLDTFALELLEIVQCHIHIMGEDSFSELAFEQKYIRLQCERELKAIAIGMRQGLLAVAGREKLFAGLSTESATRLMRTLRGMLWLKGAKEGLPEVEVITQLETMTGYPLVGVRNAINVATPYDWEAFKTLYADVEMLGKNVDQW